MATSPTSKSATQSGAAKDDVVGLDGHYTFTIADLLSNDPGGAAKVDLTKQFFFGDSIDLAAQKAYLDAHHIGYNADFSVFTINEASDDFHYMVQIGNKGTWSQADVDVRAPAPPPIVVADTHHNGALVAEWTFENHTQAGGDNVGTPSGFWNLNQWAADHLGIYGDEADQFGFSSDIQVHGVDGHRALDTAASPGNIFLQAIPEGRGGPDATMPDLDAGKDYHVEVTILKQDYSDIPEMVANGTAGTDPDAWVSFQFNGQALNVHATDVKFDGHNNEFVKFDMVFQGIEGEDSFVIQSHGSNDSAQGLLIDSIQVHDWIV